MKIIKNIFALSLLIFVSCNSQKEKNNLSTHKITFLTPYYEEYVKNAKNLDKKGRDSCLRKRRELIFIRYFTKCEILEFFNETPSDTAFTTNNFDELSENIKLLNSKQELIKKLVETALVKCHEYLQYDSVNIFIGPSSLKKEIEKKMGGVSGFTPGSKDILIFVNPSLKGWEILLESTVAHEFNHTYWIKYYNKPYSGTLLEWMVCEGKAETFSHTVYPHLKEPWDSTLSLEQKKELWDKIKPNLQSTDHSLGSDVMFGSKNYPFCGGYILGRDIVTSALKKNPNMETKYWTNFSPEFILKESGYK